MEFLIILKQTYPLQVEPLMEIKGENEIIKLVKLNKYPRQLSFVQLTYLISKFIDGKSTSQLTVLRNQFDRERLYKYYELPTNVLQKQLKFHNMFAMIDPKLLEPYINNSRLVLGDYDFHCLSFRHLDLLNVEDQKLFAEFIITQKELRNRKSNSIKMLLKALINIHLIISIVAWSTITLAVIRFNFNIGRIPIKTVVWKHFNETTEELKVSYKLSVLDTISLIFLSLVIGGLVVQFYNKFIKNQQMNQFEKRTEKTIQILKSVNEKQKLKNQPEKDTKNKDTKLNVSKFFLQKQVNDSKWNKESS